MKFLIPLLLVSSSFLSASSLAAKTLPLRDLTSTQLWQSTCGGTVFIVAGSVYKSQSSTDGTLRDSKGNAVMTKDLATKIQGAYAKLEAQAKQFNEKTPDSVRMKYLLESFSILNSGQSPLVAQCQKIYEKPLQTCFPKYQTSEAEFNKCLEATGVVTASRRLIDGFYSKLK